MDVVSRISWRASSLVGETTSILFRPISALFPFCCCSCRFVSTFSRAGNIYAKVLPLPVGAIRSRFFPPRACSADADWMGVGVKNPRSFNGVASDGNKLGRLLSDKAADIDPPTPPSLSIVSTEENRFAQSRDWLITDNGEGVNAVTRTLSELLIIGF